MSFLGSALRNPKWKVLTLAHSFSSLLTWEIWDRSLFFLPKDLSVIWKLQRGDCRGYTAGFPVVGEFFTAFPIGICTLRNVFSQAYL